MEEREREREREGERERERERERGGGEGVDRWIDRYSVINLFTHFVAFHGR